jgi:NAD(P)-dependent dehydrogenase (short-subunit alcohol dehydrogenase family)
MTGSGRGRVVVTGASTGIGRACALRLAGCGFVVLAAVRNLADGEALRTESPENIQPVTLDVTRPDSIASALTAAGGEALAGLVNNAGIAVTGPLELVSVESWRRQFETNVIGLVAVTQAFLPLLLQGKGRIVNIGSIAGRVAFPGSGAYDASKHAIEAITDALRIELHASGLSVSLIEPGAIATPLWQKTVADVEAIRQRTAPEALARYAALLATIQRVAASSERKAVSADKVAKAVQHAMTARSPKTRYLVGPETRFWLLLNLLPDRWRDRLILSQLRE